MKQGNPTLHGDADTVRVRLDAIGEPTLLVGHSYGGMVITDAGTHNSVAGLAHVAAYMPDAGRAGRSGDADSNDRVVSSWAGVPWPPAPGPRG